MSINKENTTLDYHETSISLKGNTNEIVLLSDLCLDFPKECNISDEWNHLFLYIEWINYFNAKVCEIRFCFFFFLVSFLSKLLKEVTLYEYSIYLNEWLL